MADLKAIIFDADGTLLDSFELTYSAYVHVAEVHSLRVPTYLVDDLSAIIPIIRLLV